MLSKNGDKVENTLQNENDKVITKRSYTKIKDIHNGPKNNEPKNKLRKFGEYDEHDKENSHSKSNMSKQETNETEFVKYFAPSTNMYKSLYEKNKLNPVILKRCLPYNNCIKCDNQRSSVEAIAENLQRVRVLDKNMTLIKSKTTNLNKLSVPLKIVLKFEQFADPKHDQNWETVDAEVYVDIVHWCRDNRKNKESFSGIRVVDKNRVPCNQNNHRDGPEHVVDVSKIMAGVSTERIYKSMFHFKILAKEKKLHTKNISDDKPPEDIYPVTYEAMMPFLGCRNDARVKYGRYFIQAGKYDIFPRISNMDKCDESMFSRELRGPNTTEEDIQIDLNSQWINSALVKGTSPSRDNPRLVFTISNKESIICPPHDTVKKSYISQHALTELSININSDLCLVSVKMEEKPTKLFKIFFRFFIRGKIIQWAKTSLISCPWCQSHFKVVSDLFTTLTNMLSHLNFMHPRFSFRSTTITDQTAFLGNVPPKSIIIDVTLTALCPAERDLGLKMSGKLPMRRIPLSEVIYTKTKGDVSDSLARKHERHYCHSWSSRKNKYSEFDVDSESEDNMSWLYDYYFKKVERLSQLNHVEKRVLQLWNRTLLEYGFWIRDREMKGFVEHFMQDLIDNEEKLREVSAVRNTLLMHLVNLVDYGVLAASVLLACMKRLDMALEGLAAPF